MEMIMTIDFPDGPSGVTMDHGPEPVPAGADRPRQARETPGGGRATRARQPMDGAAPASEPACARRPGADRAREVGSRGGAGLGNLILAELIRRARAHGHRSVLARITSGNAASIGLHARHAFRVVGVERRVALKHDRWLDVTVMQLLLPAMD